MAANPQQDLLRLVQTLWPVAGAEDVLRMRTGKIEALNADGTTDVSISGVVLENIQTLASAYPFLAEDRLAYVAQWRGALLVLGSPAVTGAVILPGTLVSESQRSTASGTFTAETVIQFNTFTALAGVRYEVMATQAYQSSVKDDIVRCRLRWQAGASLTTAGTQFMSAAPTVDTMGRGNQVILNATFVPGPGQVSVGVTAERIVGTGNISMFGSANQVNTIIVKTC